MKTFLLAVILPLLLIQEEQLSVNGECQIMVNDCTLSPGKLPLGGFPMNSVVRRTDSPT